MVQSRCLRRGAGIGANGPETRRSGPGGGPDGPKLGTGGPPAGGPRRRRARGLAAALLALALVPLAGCGEDEGFDQREDLPGAPRRYRFAVAEATASFDVASGWTTIELEQPGATTVLAGPPLDDFGFRIDTAERVAEAPEGEEVEPEAGEPAPGSRGTFNAVGSRLRLDVEVDFPSGERVEIHELGDRIAVP